MRSFIIINKPEENTFDLLFALSVQKRAFLFKNGFAFFVNNSFIFGVKKQKEKEKCFSKESTLRKKCLYKVIVKKNK